MKKNMKQVKRSDSKEVFMSFALRIYLYMENLRMQNQKSANIH